MPLAIVHPNLRDATELRFSAPDELIVCDVLVSALLILLTLPTMVAVALAVKLDSAAVVAA